MENTINEIKDLMAKIKEFNEKKENLSIDDLNIDREEICDNYLDDVYEPYNIGNLKFYASDVLKSCDPVAYRCYIADYFADVDIKDFSEYFDKIEEINDKIEEIKEEIKNMIDNL